MRRADGQSHEKRGAAAGTVAVRGDLAPVQLDKLFDDREPEPQAAVAARGAGNWPAGPVTEARAVLPSPGADAGAAVAMPGGGGGLGRGADPEADKIAA
jgi:hypothetical protein